jgi:hypothetical protein
MVESIVAARGVVPYAGGFGMARDGAGPDFTDCVNSGGILALANLSGQDKKVFAGGLLGDGEGSKFVDCSNRGDVKGAIGGMFNAALTGGLAAFAEPSQVLRCENYGKIEAQLPPKTYESLYLSNAAGLVSGYGANAAIKLSRNKGEAVSADIASGFVGSLMHGDSQASGIAVDRAEPDFCISNSITSASGASLLTQA